MILGGGSGWLKAGWTEENGGDKSHHSLSHQWFGSEIAETRGKERLTETQELIFVTRSQISLGSNGSTWPSASAYRQARRRPPDKV